MFEVEAVTVGDIVGLVVVGGTTSAITVLVVVDVATITVVVSIVEAMLVLLNTIKNAQVVCKQHILQLIAHENIFTVV